MEDDQEQQPESLLPYETWTQDALRQVVVRAIAYAAAHGLPGGHHFYLSFRTDHPETVIPPRLRAQYPQEMTIVLQHQFWDLRMDEEAGLIGVALSFGGVPATLVIPLGAVTAFTDPHTRFGLRFDPDMPDTEGPDVEDDDPPAADPEPAAETEAGADPEPQVVSLDAFRRRTTPKE
jgi:hypothetical protein